MVGLVSVAESKQQKPNGAKNMSKTTPPASLRCLRCNSCKYTKIVHGTGYSLCADLDACNRRRAKQDADKAACESYINMVRAHINAHPHDVEAWKITAKQLAAAARYAAKLGNAK